MTGQPNQTARLQLPGQDSALDLPVIVGSENEQAVDVSTLRGRSGYITLDSGYANTGSCTSAITFIDGEKGVLRYRGYPVEQLAEHSRFTETAWMLINGELPNKQQQLEFSSLLTEHEMLHEGLRHHFEGFPPTAHPMAILSAMINAMSGYHMELGELTDEAHFAVSAAKIISKVRTIAAFSYKKFLGHPVQYPDPARDYCSNFLHMMFSIPFQQYEPDPVVLKALNQFLILHADHEQNCSTSTVRMVASSGANLFASIAAGVCALWGPLHGGANQAVLEMLHQIRASGIKPADFLAQVKDRKNKVRLMGFGHRVYKNYDPRARVLKESVDKLLHKLGIKDPLLGLAKEMEEAALADSYFVERKLYPNVDFYSGILLRAIGIPTNMFTVMFAMGRMPGWVAHWYEVFKDSSSRIHRPRQIYTGHKQREYVPLSKRG